MRVTLAIPNRDDFKAEMVATLMRTVTQTGGLCNLTMPATCYIDNGRNQCWEDAKSFDSDYLLFIDSDNSIDHPGNAFKQLVDMKVDVASGVYVQRAFPYRPNVYDFTRDGRVRNILTVPDKPFKRDATGCGFLLISRKVMDAFTPEAIEKYGKPFNFMNYGLPNELREDVAFCWRIKQMGFELWFDPTFKMGHHGKMNFTLEHYEMAKKNIIASQKQADGSIDGWMTDAELTFLREQANRYESIVEVGSWKGRSTNEMLKMGAKVYAVDHWKGSDCIEEMAEMDDIYAEFMDNVGHYPNLVVMRMPSLEAASMLQDKVDMVFIDAGHSYEDCIRDIEAWEPKATKLICGHDYDRNAWPGVVKAVNKKYGDRVKNVDTIWYVELAA
jgi:hypothetical protein